MGHVKLRKITNGSSAWIGIFCAVYMNRCVMQERGLVGRDVLHGPPSVTASGESKQLYLLRIVGLHFSSQETDLLERRGRIPSCWKPSWGNVELACEIDTSKRGQKLMCTGVEEAEMLEASTRQLVKTLQTEKIKYML
jgi:hypothetical protein